MTNTPIFSVRLVFWSMLCAFVYGVEVAGPLRETEKFDEWEDRLRLGFVFSETKDPVLRR